MRESRGIAGSETSGLRHSTEIRLDLREEAQLEYLKGKKGTVKKRSEFTSYPIQLAVGNEVEKVRTIFTSEHGSLIIFQAAIRKMRRPRSRR